MEVGRQHTAYPLRPDAREMVIAVWRDLGEPAVNAAVLRKIQEALRQAFDGRAAISPAAIARILADAEAELHHPEVIECDSEWRASQIEREAKNFETFSAFTAGEPLRLKQAEGLMKRLEKLRHESADDARILAIEGRQMALARAKSESVLEGLREEQLEIAEWIRIWLETPSVFSQWLELRKSSPDFRKKFLAGD